uniref:Cas scaffold protein family member 4 n=1 Tax=Cyanoderma ruficeps TaxID=181631 RepID=A0A8C3QSC7_9PASS
PNYYNFEIKGLAKALYDNKAECSDELAFRRGDILTVLEQHVPGSQGWWRCSLHGHHGLAPANRLQLLPPSPARGQRPTEPPAAHNIYQVPSVPSVPSVPKATAQSATYEKMEGWVHPPATPAQAVYQVPALAAQLLSERTTRSTHQVRTEAALKDTDIVVKTINLFTLPRPCRASTPNIRGDVYDVPSPQHRGSPLLYDVPPKREFDDSENKSQKKFHYNTLPNPRKSEWIYDIPVSPENPGFKPNPPGQCVEKQVLYDIPPARYKAPATATEAKAGNPQLYDIPPTQRKLTHPEIPLYDVPSSRDLLLLPHNGSSENVYDIPKGLPSAGVDSRKIKMELEAAIETLTWLQHGVSSSIASLMIFVSSKWRLQEHLEKSLEEIHRAVDHIKVSLGEFLAFAQALKGNASKLTDSNLQARIKKQLEILMNSYEILTETREALNSCSWSLEALVLKKPQNNPDDLDRFVMVARTIPEDIKRFVSIVIANGKLLFRKDEKEQEKKQPKVSLECKMAKQIPVPRRVEIESLQRNAPEKSSQSRIPVEKPEENSTEDCDYVQLQVSETGVYSLYSSPFADIGLLTISTILPLHQCHIKFALHPIFQTLRRSRILQEPARKIPLPEHCRLCFAALHKAIGVFTASLCNQQPPEIFISHSKLIIMVGQKLVDSLCQETQEREARSDVLHGSSRFCSLLKNLALATKTAALKYPDAEASRALRERTEELAKYTQQFRAMMD